MLEWLNCLTLGKLNVMKKLLLLSILIIAALSCEPKKDFVKNQDAGSAVVGDTVRIANDDLDYELIVIDPGFNSWLLMNARRRGYYSQSYLENRNLTWVLEWNNRARNPRNTNLFGMPIDYQNGVNYGYEVNYLLYNYLTYFQLTNNLRLGGFVPRI